MATHSSILAWEVPWTEEPGGLQSMGSQKSQTRLSSETTKLTNDNNNVKKSWKREVTEDILWHCFYKMKMARKPITIGETQIKNHSEILPYACCCSVVQSCPTLYDPMDCSVPGFLVLHCLLELVLVRMAKIKKADNTNFWWSCSSPGTLLCSWWEYKNGPTPLENDLAVS